MKRLLPFLLILFLLLPLIRPLQALGAVNRENEIRELVTAFVKTRTADMGWEVKIRRLSIADALKFPDGSIDYEIVAPQQWEGWGNISIMVLARRDDRILRNVPVRLEVEALADTVVTLRQLDPGTMVTVADVIVQKREITQNSHLAERSLDAVIGKKTRTTIRSNQPVRADQLEKIAVVKSGQMVTIIAETGVLKISVTGKARSSGAEGDIIRVQNLTSLKEIPARVIDANTVQVSF